MKIWKHLYSGCSVLHLSKLGFAILQILPLTCFGAEPTFEGTVTYKLTRLHGNPFTKDTNTDAISQFLTAAKHQLHVNGIPDADFSFFIEGWQPCISGLESSIRRILPLIISKENQWAIYRELPQEQKMIRQDVRPVLERKLKLLQSRILQVENQIFVNPLPLEFVGLDDHFNYLNLDSLLTLVKEIENLGGWKDAPDRFFENRSDRDYPKVSLLTAAEQDWSEQLSSIDHSLVRFVQGLVKLKSDPISTSLKHRLEVKAATRRIFPGDDQDGGSLNPNLLNGPSALTQDLGRRFQDSLSAFLEASSYALSAFPRPTPEARHQRIPIRATALWRLYSYGLLVTMRYIERHPEFDLSFYGHVLFEQKFLNLLYPLARETIELDPVSQRLLSEIAKRNDMDPLLRLTAFSLLEQNLNFATVEKFTQIDHSEFSRLYELIPKKVVLSPTETVKIPKPHIDYKSNFKVEVEPLVKAVERTAKKINLPELTLERRLEIYDYSLPSSHDASAKLLERIAAQRERMDAKSKPLHDNVSSPGSSGKEDTRSKSNSLPLDFKTNYIQQIKSGGFAISVLPNFDVMIRDNFDFLVKMILYPRAEAVNKTALPPKIQMINGNLVIEYPALEKTIVLRASQNFANILDFSPQEYLRQRLHAEMKLRNWGLCKGLAPSRNTP